MTLKNELALASTFIDQLIEAGGEETLELQEEMRRLPQKVDSCVFVLDRLKVEIEFFKSRAAYFKKVADSLESGRERFVDYVKANMKAHDLTELTGEEFKLKLQKSAPSVEIEDENKIDAAYKNEKITYSIDKVRIKDDLAMGIAVKGASLKHGEYLKPYPNKRIK